MYLCVTIDILDPINKLPITDLELRERVLHGPYQPILSYQRTSQCGKNAFIPIKLV